MWSAAETTYKAFEDFCKRVGAASGGRLEIQPFSAGAVVGVFETLDAVSAGVLDAQSTAPVYWAGKDAGFSMIGDLNFAYQHPWQAEAWYYHRGGLDMLREAYARFNVYPVGVSWWGLEALVSKKPLKTTTTSRD
jgi:TRAP-type mannitol/chloroaromatic compound transport system substrate-binding protein